MPSPFGPVLPFKVARPAVALLFAAAPNSFLWQGALFFALGRIHSRGNVTGAVLRSSTTAPTRCGGQLAIIQDNFMPSPPPFFSIPHFFFKKKTVHFFLHLLLVLGGCLERSSLQALAHDAVITFPLVRRSSLHSKPHYYVLLDVAS